MDNKAKKSPRLFLVSLIIFTAVCGYFFWFKPKFNPRNASDNGRARLVSVSVVLVEKQQVQLFVELPGRVTSSKISEVRPQVDGIIKEIKFIEGSFVKQGQQLYQIDPRIYQASFEDASANLKALQAKKERYHNLVEYDAVSKQEFEDILAAFVKAESDLKKAKTNLAYTRVYAPISGYIGKSNVTIGALVNANQTGVLTTITALDPIYVDMVEASKNIANLNNQKDIQVSLITEDKNYQNIGTLKFSEVFADETTDSVRLRAVFSNADKKLIPGMFVNARLHLKPFVAVTVPQRATSRGPDSNLMVWVVDEQNVTRPRIIKADQVFADSWIVNEGLEDGEVIVYEGFQKIADGTKVDPVPLKGKVGK